jgi:hypothetical protein
MRTSRGVVAMSAFDPIPLKNSPAIELDQSAIVLSGG